MRAHARYRWEECGLLRALSLSRVYSVSCVCAFLLIWVIIYLCFIMLLNLSMSSLLANITRHLRTRHC
uniref:Uncharacterized protein n=1 Tax=Anguilla anguilla TaxID=7936 RepID=A0A0E9R255_ANGAN